MARRKRISWSAFGTFLFILLILGVLALERPVKPVDSGAGTEGTAAPTTSPIPVSSVPVRALLPTAPPQTKPAAAELRTIDVDGRPRRYLYQPPIGKPQGIVIAFHASESTPAGMVADAGLAKIVESGFGVAYPESRDRGWLTTRDNSALLSENTDIRFCLELMKSLTVQLDTSRVALVGRSDGARFAQLFGAIASVAIDAIVAHSGSRPEISPRIQGDVRFLAIHDASDARRVQQDLAAYQHSAHGPQVLVVPVGTAWSVGVSERVRDFLTQQR